MKKKYLITIALVLVSATMIYIKVKAGNSDTASGWIWGGSEDCDMDRNNWKDVMCGGNNTSTPIDEKGDGDIAVTRSNINDNESGLGWISFNSTNCDTDGDGQIEVEDFAPPGCPPLGTNVANYGVNIPMATSGNLSGYAWSENVGWISFNANDLTLCPSSATDGPGSCPARRENDNIKGWARILSIKNAAAENNSGGWQGWIRLSGPGDRYEEGQCIETNNYDNNNRCNYGLKIINDDKGPVYRKLSGYIWSDEFGWIEIKDAKVKMASNLVICPSPATIEVNKTEEFQAYYSNDALTCDSIPQNLLPVTEEADWITDDNDVIEVSSTIKGQVRGLREGNATLRASYTPPSASEVTASAEILVTGATPACSCDPEEAKRTCKGEYFNDSCGSPTCSGQKNCGPKWIETQP